MTEVVEFDWQEVFDSQPEDCIRLPSSVHAEGRCIRRLLISLSSAFISTSSAILLIYLVKNHVPEDSICVADHYPAGKVILTMFVSAIAACFSILLAVPMLLIRNLIPLLWLAPLAVGALMFYEWYDWYGLFMYG